MLKLVRVVKIMSYFLVHTRTHGYAKRLDEKYFVDRHRCHMATKFGVFVDEEHSKLPSLFTYDFWSLSKSFEVALLIPVSG